MHPKSFSFSGIRAISFINNINWHIFLKTVMFRLPTQIWLKLYRNIWQKSREIYDKMSKNISYLLKIYGFFYKIHCVESVRIRSYSGPYFPALRPNTERYSVSLRIQSNAGKQGPEYFRRRTLFTQWFMVN